jgi:hypothetical protein
MKLLEVNKDSLTIAVTCPICKKRTPFLVSIMKFTITPLEPLCEHLQTDGNGRDFSIDLVSDHCIVEWDGFGLVKDHKLVKGDESC